MQLKLKLSEGILKKVDFSFLNKISPKVTVSYHLNCSLLQTYCIDQMLAQIYIVTHWLSGMALVLHSKGAWFEIFGWFLY